MTAQQNGQVRVILCDRREDVVEAWRLQFEEKSPEVEIRQGDILEVDADAFVVPGNAFGFLDRGLEMEISERFGWEVQDALRETIRSRFDGELLVGQGILHTLSTDRRLLYVPIVRTPRKLTRSLNAYLAARGAFLTLKQSAAAEVSSVVLPGFGTGASALHPLASARQIRYAYEIFAGKRGFGDKNLSQLRRRERKLRSVPRSTPSSGVVGDDERRE